MGSVLEPRLHPELIICSTNESDAHRTASGPGPPGAAWQGYLAEIEELRGAGLVVEPDPSDSHAHRFYIKEPARSWYNEAIFSIGIYTGPSPLHLGPAPGVRNPVVTRDHVTDVPAAFVADPFLLRTGNTWHLFFEVMNWRTERGEIGLAISRDGVHWEHQRIVLAEPFHLSYPFVFQWQAEYYMIPETYQAGAVRLYRALDFPTRWSPQETLLRGPYLVDATVFRHDERWWLYTDTSPAKNHDTLRLYFADALRGPWVEHPRSPLIQGNDRIARPAGRVLAVDGQLIRFTQNCVPYYGTEVRAFAVDRLTPTDYQERERAESPILKPSATGWSGCGMHHVDAHRLEDGSWFAAVDGWYNTRLLNEAKARR
jgi:hypothetical protein